MTDNSLKYRVTNSLMDVNTLAPGGNFFYRIQRPKELNKSAWGCKIAFYDLQERLIYHRSKTYAQELHSKPEIELSRAKMLSGQKVPDAEQSSIELVKWSLQGNLAYFLEHYSWNYDRIYESVFLNLRDQNCYRIDELKNNFAIVSGLNLHDRQYDENLLVQQLDSLGIKRQGLYKDVPTQRLSDKLLSRNTWQPK